MVQADRPQLTISYGACSLHGGSLRLQTHTQNIYYLFLFYGNNGYANAPAISELSGRVISCYFQKVNVKCKVMNLNVYL